MIAIPHIETKRPTLLANLESNLHAMNDYLSKNRMSFITGPFDDVGTWRTQFASLGHWLLCDFGIWHSEQRESGKMVGAVSFLHHFDWPETELGWNVHQVFKGKAVPYEAALAARRYGQTHLNTNGVISFIDPVKTRSAALANRLSAPFEKNHYRRKYECHVYRHPVGDPPQKAIQSETN